MSGGNARAPKMTTPLNGRYHLQMFALGQFELWAALFQVAIAASVHPQSLPAYLVTRIRIIFLLTLLRMGWRACTFPTRHSIARSFCGTGVSFEWPDVLAAINAARFALEFWLPLGQAGKKH